MNTTSRTTSWPRRLAPGVRLLVVLLLSTTSLIAADVRPSLAAAERAYVTNSGEDTVSVLDASSGALLTTIPVGDQPREIAASADGTRVYTANTLSDTVTVIDTVTNSVIQTVPTINEPIALAMTSDGQRLYVAGTTGIAVIDTATFAMTTWSRPDMSGEDILLSPDEGRLFVFNFTPDASPDHGVAILDATNGQQLRLIPVPPPDFFPEMALSPDGNRLYGAEWDLFGSEGSIDVIDVGSGTMLASVPVTTSAFGIALTTDGGKAYVTDQHASAVVIFDTTSNTIVGSIPVGTQPLQVSFGLNGTRAFVANHSANTVSVIDAATDSVVATWAVGSQPYQVVPVAVPADAAPEAADDAYATDEDVPLTLAAPGVLANDSDPGDILTAVPLTGPESGTVALASDGSFTYTPAPDFHGTETFTYLARDAAGQSSAPATVTITVASVNDGPVAADDVYETDEDVALTVAAPGVLGNDTDGDGDTLDAELVRGTTHGSLALNPDGSFTYNPTADFNGTDSFTYLARDPSGASSSVATATIIVGPVEDPPVAADDDYATDEDVELSVPAPGVLGNDTDPDGDSLSAALVSGTTHGTLALEPDGSFTYAPDLNFHGTDTFTYRAWDPAGGLSEVATVTVTVNSVNDPPSCDAVRGDLTVLWPPDHTLRTVGLSGATDVDGDVTTLHIAGVTQDEPLNGTGDGDTGPDAAHGDASHEVRLRAERAGNGDGRVYQVAYRVDDGAGGSCSGTVTVAVPQSQNGEAATESALSVNSFGG